MLQYEKGELVISLCGRDADAIYVVVQQEPGFVYVSDGKKHLLSKTKRKNVKHIQLIHERTGCIVQELTQKMAQGTLRDENVKYAIKCYRKSL